MQEEKYHSNEKNILGSLNFSLLSHKWNQAWIIFFIINHYPKVKVEATSEVNQLNSCMSFSKRTVIITSPRVQ